MPTLQVRNFQEVACIGSQQVGQANWGELGSDSGIGGRSTQLTLHGVVFLAEAFVFEGDILRTAVSVGIS